MIQLCLELRRRGHEVLTVGPGDGTGWLGGELRKLGFEWRSIPRRYMVDPRAVMDHVRYIKDFGVDVIHAHEFAPSVYGAAAAGLTGRVCVMTLHSNMYFAQAWRRRVAYRWAITHSHPVAVSRDTAHDVEKVLELPQGTIHVIPNGIASEPGRREPLRAELGLRPDELLIVALGNVSARKAHIIILRALIELEARRPGLPWRFALAGTDQGAMSELQSVIAEHKLENRVHLLGHRSDTDNVLAASDVFAMSSLHEGMPLAIMEAMFAGKPVVTSTAGGIAEMIDDGTDGLLVPVGEVPAMSAALERVLADAALRTRLSEAATKRAVRQFGIGAMMDAYERLYTSSRPVSVNASMGA